VFTNREIAVLAWGLVGLVYAIRIAGPSILSLLQAFFVRHIVTAIAGMALYTVGILAVLSRVGLWEVSLLKDTIVWFTLSALVSMADAVRKGPENPRFFREVLLDNLKLVIVLEFVLDTFVLPLALELVLVPLAFFLGAMQAVAGTKPEYESVGKLFGCLISGLGLGLLVYAMVELIRGFGQFGTVDTLKEFALAPLLTIMSIPFLFGLSLYVAYEGLFMRLPVFLKDHPDLVRYAKLRALYECRWHLPRLDKLRGRFYADLSDASDRSAVAEVIHRYGNLEPPDPADAMTGEVVAFD
jgi:hypothetical protein